MSKHITVILLVFYMGALVYYVASSHFKKELYNRAVEFVYPKFEPELFHLCLIQQQQQQQNLVPFLVTQHEYNVDQRILDECVYPRCSDVNDNSGTIAVIKLRLHHLDQRNLYHLFAMESSWWCLYLTTRTLKKKYDHIFIDPVGVTNLTHSVATGLLNTFGLLIQTIPPPPQKGGNNVYEVYGPGVAAVYQSRSYSSVKLPWPLWAHKAFEIGGEHIGTNLISREMINHVINTCKEPGQTVYDIILIQRRKTRKLRDVTTRAFQTVLQSLSQIRSSVKMNIVEFSETDNFCKTVNMINNARVLVGVHGAGLTHLAFLNPNYGTVVEILMRPGFEHRGYYDKGEYANMAKLFGIKYRYIDSIQVSPPGCGIYCDFVFVNSTELSMGIKNIL